MIEPTLEEIIRSGNPWWLNNSHKPSVSPLKRWVFEPVLRRLKGGMTPVVALRGPRQVGKTTLMQQIIQQLLDEGVPPHHILRVQFDDLPTFTALQEPILGISYWFEQHILGQPLNSIQGAVGLSVFR